MHIRQQRLLNGLRQAIDELAALSGDPLRAKIHQGAAHTMLAELARGDSVHNLRDRYERGRDLALRLTAALLDRLLHHAHIVPIAGESYRLKHQRQAGMVQSAIRNEIAPGNA